MISTIFEQFVEATPVTVMVKGIMERIFEPSALNSDLAPNEKKIKTSII
jgi:hypothetical protein